MVAQLRAVNESLEEKISDLKNKVFIVLFCYYIKYKLFLHLTFCLKKYVAQFKRGFITKDCQRTRKS